MYDYSFQPITQLTILWILHIIMQIQLMWKHKTGVYLNSKQCLHIKCNSLKINNQHPRSLFDNSLFGDLIHFTLTHTTKVVIDLFYKY